MGREIYLCLSVLQSGTMSGGFMAFLVLAASQEEASASADLFIESIETLSRAERTHDEMRICHADLTALRRSVILITEDSEIRALSAALTIHYPDIARHLLTHIGCTILLTLDEDSSFPADTRRMLRSRMAKHHVLASLTVDLV